MTDETAHSPDAPLLGRRQFLQFGTAAAVTATILTPFDAFAARLPPHREVSLLNVNTGERLTAEYWVKGKYQRDALREISRLLRDHRTGAMHTIDPRLLDLVYALRSRVGVKKPFHVISGYRSPQSNAQLREENGSSVARHSFHMEGKAIDIRVPGASLGNLHKAALRMKAGGVGYYPQDNFVHVDVGPVRQW